ncbi:uncharacterized protein EV154DRAFT_153461 [Mucor mucedo]|uniref:uncharacterized protein n=1 Tax=Mucor mucedo TaxID=29922 RepID=UPI0022200C43|nr:uncharacterized protein EV154DRAFT_153461 [Mucor mucedo]KAI7866925.1 hypothetical protein EV154DRAFT_153461 [Mucor mucedo]
MFLVTAYFQLIRPSDISVKAGSIGCLEVLVNHDEVDLDIQDRIGGDTPLHLAVQYANKEHDMAFAMIDLLLAGGADPNITNRNKMTPIMICNPKYKDIIDKLDGASVAYNMDDSDIANHEEDDDAEGSASEED